MSAPARGNTTSPLINHMVFDGGSIFNNFLHDSSNKLLLANQLRMQLDQCKLFMGGNQPPPPQLSTNNGFNSNQSNSSFKIDDILNNFPASGRTGILNITKSSEDKFLPSSSSFTSSSRPSSSSSLSSSPPSSYHHHQNHHNQPMPQHHPSSFNDMIENLLGNIPSDILAQHVSNFQLSMNGGNPFLAGQLGPYMNGALAQPRAAVPPTHQPLPSSGSYPFEFLRNVNNNSHFLNSTSPSHVTSSNESDESLAAGRNFSLMNELVKQQMEGTESINPTREGDNINKIKSARTESKKTTVKNVKKEHRSAEGKVKVAKKAKKEKKSSNSCVTCSGNCADITCSISSVLPIDQSQLPMCLRGASEEQLNLASLFNTLMHHKKCRRTRTVFSDMQMIGLEKRFENQKYLSTPDRIQLADSLGLSQLQVKTWYQNRRMKWKKKVLKDGSREAPTKPKGRPKKNSIPSFSDIIKAAEAAAGGGNNNQSVGDSSSNESLVSHHAMDSEDSENDEEDEDDDDDDDVNCVDDSMAEEGEDDDDDAELSDDHDSEQEDDHDKYSVHHAGKATATLFQLNMVNEQRHFNHNDMKK